MKIVSISAVVIAAGLALTGCSSDQTTTEDTQAAATTGAILQDQDPDDDPLSCFTPPADGTVDIVATTQTWADVAKAAAPGANVTTIIKGGSEDPHEYEPSAQDMQAINTADLIVVNGAGYDQWAYDGKENDPRFIFAQKPGEDPDLSAHVFFDTDNLEYVATRVAACTDKMQSEANADSVTQRLNDFEQRMQAAAAGKGVMQTETVADYIITKSGMNDMTPAGYREASLKEEEPAAADLDQFLTTLRSGDVSVLFVNPDTASGTTDRIRAAAEESGVAIIEIGETPGEGENFLDYFDSIITELTNATAA